MAQPTPYNRYFNFVDQQALTPSDPLLAEKVDGEFNRIKTTLDEVLNNIALIQRDDGALANGSVGSDQLSADLTLGFDAPEAWETATSYVADSSTVFINNKFYVCAVSHTSGTFATDLANSYWTLLADFSTSNTIDDGTIANAKLEDMVASRIKGRVTTTGAPQDLSAAQVRAIIGMGDGSETDNAVVRFNGTDGSIQGSGIVVDDNDAVTGVGGSITINGTAAAAAKLVLGEDTDNGSNTLTLQAAASMSANFTLTAPAADGMANYGMGTDGSGNLGWYPYARLNAANNFSDSTIQRANLLDYGEITNAIGDFGGGTQDIDLESGNVVSATVSTSTVTFTFSNPTASDESCSFTLHLTNGGSQTVNWPSSVDWEDSTAPSLTASGKDILVFTTIDGGTTWYGFAAGLDMG